MVHRWWYNHLAEKCQGLPMEYFLKPQKRAFILTWEATLCFLCVYDGHYFPLTGLPMSVRHRHIGLTCMLYSYLALSISRSLYVPQGIWPSLSLVHQQCGVSKPWGLALRRAPEAADVCTTHPTGIIWENPCSSSVSVLTALGARAFSCLKTMSLQWPEHHRVLKQFQCPSQNTVVLSLFSYKSLHCSQSRRVAS